MFLLLVIYTDGSFLAPEAPKSLHILQTLPKFVSCSPSLYLPKLYTCFLYYHLPNSFLNSNFKLSTYLRFTLNQSIWETKHLGFFLKYIKINTE